MGHFFTPRNLFLIAWRRLPIILLVLIIGLPLVLLFAQSRDKMYEARAVIQIEAPQIVQTGAMPVMPASDGQIELIQQKLGSRNNMEEVVRLFNLFPEEDSINERVSYLRGAVEIVKLIDPSQQFRPDATPSGLIITVQMGDPEQATEVANHFLNAILEEASRRAEARAESTLAFFDEEERRVSAEILTLETQLADFKEANQGSLPTEITAQQSRVSTLQEAKLAIDQQLVQLQTGSERIRDDELARQTNLLIEQQSFFQSEIDKVQAALQAAPTVERQVNGLQRELDQLEAEYVEITSSRTEAAIRERLETQDQAQRFEVLETAVVPDYAVSTSRTKIAIAGGLAVGMMALGLAFLAELMRPVIRNSAQLEAQLGLLPVITVPNLNGRVKRRRRIMGVLALVLGAGGAVGWFFGGLRDLVMRSGGGSATPT